MHQGSDLLNQLGDFTAEAATLKKLCLELGDLGLTEGWFDATEDWELAAVSAPTWDTLEQQGFVRRGRRPGMNTYRLTDAGWIAGLEAAGILSSKEFLARCEGLVAYFASQLALQAMPYGALISPHRLEADELASGWVLNVIRTGLLTRVFPDRCMDARWDPSLQNVRVRPGFGSSLSALD